MYIDYHIHREPSPKKKKRDTRPKEPKYYALFLWHPVWQIPYVSSFYTVLLETTRRDGSFYVMHAF